MLYCTEYSSPSSIHKVHKDVEISAQFKMAQDTRPSSWHMHVTWITTFATHAPLKICHIRVSLPRLAWTHLVPELPLTIPAPSQKLTLGETVPGKTDVSRTDVSSFLRRHVHADTQSFLTKAQFAFSFLQLTASLLDTMALR